MSSEALMPSVVLTMMKKPAMIVAVLGIYLGFGLFWLGEQRDMPISYFMERYGWTWLGSLIMTASMLYIIMSISQASREKRFIDIDDRAATSSDSTVIDKLIDEIEELKQLQPSVDYQRIEELIRKSSVIAPKPELDALKSFDNYFNAL